MENFINLYQPNQICKFWPTDGEKPFRKNRKKLGKNWKYRNSQILYKTNEFGFRTRKHAEIDWANSIVMFGCSNVFGIGIHYEDTIAQQLERLIGIPVINLGIPGSALDIAVFNSFHIYSSVAHPKALIQIWTSPYRYTEFYTTGDIATKAPFVAGYNPRLDTAFKNRVHIYQDRALWKNSNTIYREYSHFDDWLYLEQDLGIKVFEEFDKARDLSHPGAETNRHAANVIYRDLYKLGL
jgi:hypothetical protein